MKKRALIRVSRLLRGVVVLFTVSCEMTQCPNEPGTEERERAEARTLTLTASPSALTVPVGAAVETALAISYPAPFVATFFATDLPPGVSVVFSDVQSQATSRMIVSASAAAVPGRYEFNAETSGFDGLVRKTATQRVTLDIVRPFIVIAPAPTTVVAGGSVEVDVGITRIPNYDGVVALRVLPNTIPVGTIAQFTPSESAGNRVVLRLAVLASTPAGRYVVKVEGSARGVVDTTQFDLTVTDFPVPPDIAIAATPLARTITAGESASFDLALSRTVPSIGVITLSATGLPNGATATFAPTAVAGTSSQLVISTTSSTPPGNYTLGVVATAGTLVKQTTVALTVNSAADFSMIASPNSFTVVRGNSVSSTLLITRTGDVGAVQLTTANVPTGFTVAYNPAATTANSAVTIGVAATVPAGFHQFDLVGTARGRTRTARVGVTVLSEAPPTVTVVVGSPELVLTPGETALVPVRLIRTGTAIGQLLELRVTGFPLGGNVRHSPAITYGDTATLQIIGGTPGRSIITVVATFGIFPPAAFIDVTVVPSTTPNFSILSLPGVLRLSRGVVTDAWLEIVRVNGFTGDVNFDVITDSPGNYTVEFFPANRMQVTVGPNVPLGDHVLIIRGFSGGQMRTTLMTLQVVP